MDPQNLTGRVFHSPYMEWVKTRPAARLNLATSGVPGVSLRDLEASIGDLEINGPGGYGYTPLREAIAAQYHVPPECIVAGGGTSGANQYAFLALLGPGDNALIEFPAYDILPSLARFCGADVTWFRRRPENDWQIDPDEIASRITPRTRLVILTNLHNPGGALTSRATLVRIGEIAARHGAYVLVDEVYLDCVWDNPQPTSFGLGPNFIVTSSLTKVYGFSGLRCGWIFAPGAIADRIRKLTDLLDNIPSHVAELLSVMAFGRLATFRERSRILLETNRAIWREFAGAYGFEVPQYGTVAFPHVGPRAHELCALLRAEYEITVVPGHFFLMPEHIRISLAIPPETLREGLARCASALARVGGMGNSEA